MPSCLMELVSMQWTLPGTRPSIASARPGALPRRPRCERASASQVARPNMFLANPPEPDGGRPDCLRGRALCRSVCLWQFIRGQRCRGKEEDGTDLRVGGPWVPRGALLPQSDWVKL